MKTNRPNPQMLSVGQVPPLRSRRVHAGSCVPGKRRLAGMILLVAAGMIAPASGADLLSGYTVGAGSELLSANGGGGSTLFNDAGALGGSDANGTVAPFFSVLLDGSGLWNLGDTVSITGFALPLVDNATDTGTFTFDIRQGAGGTGASGTAGLSSLGTATAAYTSGSGTSVYYVNFDTPVTFVADANSTSIVINWGSTAQMRWKKRAEPTGAALPQVNYGNGNFVGGNDTVSVSVAGTVTGAPDTDSDGLNDEFETGGSFANGDPLGTFVSATDAGTWVDVPDSDGDGINDGDEVFGDKVSGQSYTSDPTMDDTDFDGLDDGDEVNGTLNTAYGNAPTDPDAMDTDGDGIDDDVEINTTGTNPAAADTDGDGLDDGVEDVNRNGVVDTGETSATSDDSDMDTLPDGWEVANGLDPRSDLGDNGGAGDPDGDLLVNSDEYNGGINSTDPNDADSDNDKTNDKAEFDNGVTNPNSRDTDGDTLSDTQELALGLDPTAIADFDNDDGGAGNGFDHHEVLFYETDPKSDLEIPPLVGEQADLLLPGYVIGGGDLGTDLLIDQAAIGGALDPVYANGNTDFTIVYDGLFAPGASVRITGIAVVLNRANGQTVEGDILFRFFDLGADGVFDGIDCETQVGSAVASLLQEDIDGAAANASAYFVEFTTPITFTAGSGGLAVKFQSTGSVRLKGQNNFPDADGLFVRDDGKTWGAGTLNMRLSIAGTAVGGGTDGIAITGVSGGPGGFQVDWTTSGSVNGVDLYRSTDLQNWGGPISTDDQDGTHTDGSAPAGDAFYIAVPTGDPAP